MPRYKVTVGDYRDVVQSLSQVETMFADPPDNIDLGYDEYNDNLDANEYYHFLETLVRTGLNIAQTSYLSVNAKWVSSLGHIICKIRQYGWHNSFEDRWLVQGFTFGQHNHHDMSNDFRPILRLRNEDAPLFPDACRIESERMKIGDKRANPAGRVPGDVFFSDFLEYARVTGNSKQRRAWHPTQLNEGVVEDCLLMSTPPGGIVFDPFCGTGTTLRVCLANGWGCITCDVSEDYCTRVADEHGLVRIADRPYSAVATASPKIWVRDI